MVVARGMPMAVTLDMTVIVIVIVIVIVVVVAIGAVHMGGGDRLMGMTVIVVVMAVRAVGSVHMACGHRARLRVMLMRVAVSMSVAVRKVRRCIGAALGLEGFQGLGDDQMLGPQHVGQHMVGLELEVVGFELKRDMAVAQVVGRSQQVEGAAVLGTGAHHQHRLRRSLHANQ